MTGNRCYGSNCIAPDTDRFYKCEDCGRDSCRNHAIVISYVNGEPGTLLCGNCQNIRLKEMFKDFGKKDG